MKNWENWKNNLTISKLLRNTYKNNTSSIFHKLLQNSTKYQYRALQVFGEKLFAPVLSKKAQRRLQTLSLFSDRIICSKVLSFTSLTAGYIDLQNPKILQTNRQLDEITYWKK